MKQKLLLVNDDKESLRRSLRHSLSSETYEVVLAESLQQAIANSQASEIDPLLMNLDSPTEDEGWEAMEQSRKRIRSLAEAAGDRALVEEPVDRPMLRSTIRESLEEAVQSRMRHAYNHEIDFRHVPPGSGDFLDLLYRRYTAPFHSPLPHSRWGINE
jgi:CheY-like chemotaxis protein